MRGCLGPTAQVRVFGEGYHDKGKKAAVPLQDALRMLRHERLEASVSLEQAMELAATKPKKPARGG